MPYCYYVACNHSIQRSRPYPDLFPRTSKSKNGQIWAIKSTVVASSPAAWHSLGAIISRRSDGRHRQSWIPSAPLKILCVRVRACDVTVPILQLKSICSVTEYYAYNLYNRSVWIDSHRLASIRAKPNDGIMESSFRVGGTHGKGPSRLKERRA